MDQAQGSRLLETLSESGGSASHARLREALGRDESTDSAVRSRLDAAIAAHLRELGFGRAADD
ncbi:MAG: hypothetical protein ACFCUO_05315 [Rhodospirillales bacterium]